MNGLKPLLLLLSAEKHSTTIGSALLALCLPIQLNLTQILTPDAFVEQLRSSRSTVALLFSDKDTTYVQQCRSPQKWLETKLK